jgi:hypothetical protein
MGTLTDHVAWPNSRPVLHEDPGWGGQTWEKQWDTLEAHWQVRNQSETHPGNPPTLRIPFPGPDGRVARRGGVG